MAKLRSLADSLDDYARKIRAIGDSLDDCVRQIRSIAEIIRSVEDEKSVQASVENTAAIPSSENNPSISRHSASAPSRDRTALVQKGWRMADGAVAAYQQQVGSRSTRAASRRFDRSRSRVAEHLGRQK